MSDNILSNNDKNTEEIKNEISIHINQNKEQDEPSKNKGKVSIIMLIVICIGIVVYEVYYSTNTILINPRFLEAVQRQILRLVGGHLVNALIIWGIFRVAFLRKRNTNLNGIAFFAIFMALFVGSLIAAFKQKDQAIKTISFIQQEMNSVANTYTGAGKFSSHVEKAPIQATKTSDEFGEIERYVKECISRLVDLNNSYLLEITAIGWNSILDARRIKNDPALSESMVMIEKAKTIVDKYEKKVVELIQFSKTHIHVLNMSESSKRELMIGFEEGMNESDKKIKDLWGMEKQAICQFENIFLLFAKSKNWVVENDKILFYSDEELELFNSYLQKIQNLKNQQEQLQKSQLAELNQNLESIKNAIRW